VGPTSNQPPNTPTNQSPLNSAIVSPPVTLQSSAFSDVDGGDSHQASQWQITDVAVNYSNPVYDSGEDTINKISITVPAEKLSQGKTYYWRVRHQDSQKVWSDWSHETSFITEDEGKKDLSIPINLVGSPGQKGVVVPIQVSNAVGIAGVEIAFTYDANILKAVNASTTKLTQGFNLTSNLDISGKVILALASATDISEGSGSIVDVSFDVQENAKPCDMSELKFEQNISLFDQAVQPIPFTTKDGKLLISCCTKGDLNGDDKINSGDSIITLRIAVGLAVPDERQKCAGDVNCDGKRCGVWFCSNEDCLQCLQRISESSLALCVFYALSVV
jgi:hypothetical protein